MSGPAFGVVKCLRLPLFALLIAACGADPTDYSDDGSTSGDEWIDHLERADYQGEKPGPFPEPYWPKLDVGLELDDQGLECSPLGEWCSTADDCCDPSAKCQAFDGSIALCVEVQP